MQKSVILRKNQEFFYADVAAFIQELDFFHFIIENFYQTEPVTAIFGNEKQIFLKITHKTNEEEREKITTSNRLELIMKMWRSIGGGFDEKCQFEFNDIAYDFEIKGYQMAPGFVLTPEEIEKIQKFTGEEPVKIIAELNISSANE